MMTWRLFFLSNGKKLSSYVASCVCAREGGEVKFYRSCCRTCWHFSNRSGGVIRLQKSVSSCAFKQETELPEEIKAVHV